MRKINIFFYLTATVLFNTAFAQDKNIFSCFLPLVKQLEEFEKGKPTPEKQKEKQQKKIKPSPVLKSPEEMGLKIKAVINLKEKPYIIVEDENKKKYNIYIGDSYKECILSKINKDKITFSCPPKN